MRSVADRIRHALCFEIIGLILVTQLSGWLFNTPLVQFGVLALALSVLATLWNYVYNLAFDHAMLRLVKRVEKTLLERVLHAFLFEVGMLIITLPLVVWWMEYGLMEAFKMSIALMIFYLVYVYIYNIVYDKLFPIPPLETSSEAQ